METPQSFRILKISAYSDLPLRNSVDQLVFGHHILWENENVTDGDKGSFEPNAFTYDFVSPVASIALFDVTIKPIDGELIGKEYCLYGNLDSDTTISNIFESDSFSIESLDAITIKARVAQPNTSAQPFSWTGDFTWVIEQKSINQKVTCAHPTATRLELYWISSDINAIFLTGHSGIPVELLRTVIPKFTIADLGTLDVMAPDSNWATRVTFYNYSKTYDTVRGAAHFGVSYSGGTFWYNSYIRAAAGGRPGSFQRIVNCYDQAAMVQVVESLGPTQRPTWLYQQPYGYILQTNLVGVGQCNNPFFRSNNTTPIIGRDDRRRTAFGNHAFNGIPGASGPHSDRIYDACGGPHLGDLPQTYQNTAIDRATILSNSGNTGNINNIRRYNGVTGTTFADRESTSKIPSKGMEDLIQKSVAINPNARSFSQLHWGNVPQWIKSVLGENCEVAFQEFHIESGLVEVVWYLSGVDHGGEDDTLVLDIRTTTSIGSDGNLDLAKSYNMAIDNLHYELKNTEMELGPNDEVLDTLWVPAPFGEYTQHAVQYAPGIPSGHVLIGSGNCTIHLYGGPSSSSLEPIVNKILSHTTFRGNFPVQIPNVSEHYFDIPEVTRGYASNVVKGIGSSFEVSCKLPHSIAAATAHVLDYGLLLKDYTIDNAAAEGTSAVTFTFVTWKTGTHDIDLLFASTPELISITKRIQVEVIEA